MGFSGLCVFMYVEMLIIFRMSVTLAVPWKVKRLSPPPTDQNERVANYLIGNSLRKAKYWIVFKDQGR